MAFNHDWSMDAQRLVGAGLEVLLSFWNIACISGVLTTWSVEEGLHFYSITDCYPIGGVVYSGAATRLRVCKTTQEPFVFWQVLHPTGQCPYVFCSLVVRQLYLRRSLWAVLKLAFFPSYKQTPLPNIFHCRTRHSDTARTAGPIKSLSNQGRCPQPHWYNLDQLAHKYSRNPVIIPAT